MLGRIYVWYQNIRNRLELNEGYFDGKTALKTKDRFAKSTSSSFKKRMVNSDICAGQKMCPFFNIFNKPL